MTKIQITPKWRDVKPQGFYVYLHRRATDGGVFYVGKGFGRRGWATTRIYNKHWGNVARKHGVFIDVYKDDLRETCAFTLEKIIIGCIGIKNLCNQTPGGDGTSGHRAREIHCSNGMVFGGVTDAVNWLRDESSPNATSSGISSAVGGRYETAYGFTWSYKDDCVEYVSPRKRQAKTISTKVYCSNGMVFSSFMSAERWLKGSGFPKADKVNIRNCCDGKYKSAYGLVWSRCKDVGSYVDPKIRSSRASYKPVVRSDGVMYESVTMAAMSVGARPSNISRVCRGERKTYKGYGWSFA